jgi:hypothetical protein
LRRNRLIAGHKQWPDGDRAALRPVAWDT